MQNPGIRHMMLKKIGDKFKHRQVMFYLLDRLKGLGIVCKPFYVVLEGQNNIRSLAGPDVEDFSVAILSEGETLSLAGHSEAEITEERLEQRIRKGSQCFAMKSESRIVAFMWYNLKTFDAPWMKFDLLPDEAYLFDAKTYKAFRGKKLAPFLRQELYAHLNSLGRSRFYSVTEYFNTPAYKFKQKIGAVNLSLHLHIELFDVWRTNIRLKTFRHRFPSVRQRIVGSERTERIEH